MVEYLNNSWLISTSIREACGVVYVTLSFAQDTHNHIIRETS